jgi:glycosyltransferase involved in cell wall biosynthesis
MPDTLRAAFFLKYPLFVFRAQRLLKQMSSGENNNHTILYIYGPPSLDNIPFLWTAKRAGYKIVFDIVEDDDLAYHISTSCWHKVNNRIVRFLTRITLMQADGIIVISSHLQYKMERMVEGRIPVHLRQISVDSSCFQSRPKRVHDTLDLLYSGSFGMKDGVGVLIDAFEVLAGKHKNIRLLMTGEPTDSGPILNRIERSKHKERIIFLGYLSDHKYYDTIISSDILCVPRIDLPYAHAGFPFKLGEFLASGKPVVVSRTGDVELYLKDLDSAMLVDPGSADAIVNAVDFLVSNQEAAKSIGHKGQSVAVNSFDYSAQGKKLFSFLKNI